MTCRSCMPGLEPVGERRGEHHFAVRFGKDCRLFVRKDGEIIKDCYEVDVETGLAWRYATPPRRCDGCGRNADAYVDAGSFVVSTA